MKSGKARLSRALVMSGIVATAVVLGGGGPAPGQVPEDPDGPEVIYLDAFGPAVLGYEDCDGTVHTEVDPLGVVFVELDYEVEADVSVGLAYTGSLAGQIPDLPAPVEVPAGDSFGAAEFLVEDLQEGELTVTAEPGVGYTVSADDTYTIEVSTEPEIVASCTEDLGTPPGGTDRQTIDVGERPDPIGFFDDFEEDGGDSGDDVTTSTAVDDTATTEPVEQAAPGFARIRSLRAAPQGYDTPVANGSLPPGLTYVDDVWGGAATTPGTYAFDVRVCLDQTAFTVEAGRQGGARRPLPRAFPAVICFGQVDVQVLVRAVDPTPPAGPARPVTAAARFAG